MVPEVTGVSPNTGPMQGGQRVVLRGSYLGESREDVVQVLVAGVDCTSSLDYFSPCELFSPEMVQLASQLVSFLCSQASCDDWVSSCTRQWACCGPDTYWWSWCVLDQFLVHCR